MLPFSKYHGLGNDFILLDSKDLDAPLELERVRDLCDRHTGIGGDGVLVRELSKRADHRMTLWNADGSPAEISGNGLRCFVLFLCERGYPVTGEITVETGGGVMGARIVGEQEVETTMPPPTGLSAGQNVAAITLQSEDLEFEVVRVTVGNPHGVIFGRKRDIGFARRYGPALERNPVFPAGANIHFAHIVDRRTADLVTWERGAGITQACGSGSVATACAGAAIGSFDFEVPISVRMPGGTLQITVGHDFQEIRQKGVAERVFGGTLA